MCLKLHEVPNKYSEYDILEGIRIYTFIFHLIKDCLVLLERDYDKRTFLSRVAYKHHIFDIIVEDHTSLTDQPSLMGNHPDSLIRGH